MPCPPSPFPWRSAVRAILLGGLASLAIAAHAAPARAAAPVPMRLPATVQPTGYTLHLVVDPEQPRHSGEVEIDLKLLQPVPAGGAIRLHARDLQLRAVWLESGAQRWVGRVQKVDNERVDLRFGRPLPAGPARLGLAFQGGTDDKDVYGLFRQRDGGHWAAYTQFQATGARLAFPLFDEPGWKVPWSLSLTVPEDLTAVANMPVQAEEAAGPGRKRVRFETTPPLPSYLLAFAVGRFDLREAGSVSGTLPGSQPVPQRFVTPVGRAAESDYAAAVTARIVARLEDYFGLPYPYAKLDSLAVPVTTGFSAMEHPGLITYGARSLLARPGEAGIAFQREYLATAAHELAHQWFGNLVTLAWWDDLWLNESFASWMGDRVTAEVMPGWGWHTSQQRARARAMAADRLASARRVEEPVNTDDDMGNLWDAITYEKGQSVLAMFEAWLGPERFQAGVRRYLQRHAWGVATGDDFFSALAVDDPTLPAAVRSFTRQGGTPVVSATLRCDDGPPRLLLAQRRLLPLGSPGRDADRTRWQIPLVLRTPAGTSRLLLQDAEATLALPDASCPDWVQANAGGHGYYRVAYGGDGLARLAGQPGLSDAERMVLLDDAEGLHAAGLIDTAQVLALVQAQAGHPAREVVESALDLLGSLKPLVDAPQRAAWAHHWQAGFGERARALGWLPRPGDTDDDRLLRRRLLPALAREGQDAALQGQALALAQQWLADRSTLASEQRTVLLPAAALASAQDASAAGDAAAAALFDALQAALAGSTDRRERRDLLTALGSFPQPALAQRARELLLSPAIDLRDSLGPVLWTQAAEPAPRADALAFVARRHADLARRMGREEPAGLSEYFEAGCSTGEARQIEAAFRPHAARYPGGKLSLQRTLEAVTLCSAWKARQAGGL